MKKIIFAIVIFCVLTVTAVLVATYLFLTAPGTQDETFLYTIVPGTPLSEVATHLEKKNIIRSAGLLELIARLKGVDRRINAGRYEIEPGKDAIEVLDIIVSGEITVDRVTIPEGLTIMETASILNASINIDSTSFVHIANDSTTLQSLGFESKSLEGYLFPATYNFYLGMSAQEALKAMTKRYRSAVTEEYQIRARELGYSIHEIITLASIIEQEARIAEERVVIAGVFHNRLNQGMLLEADPTVKFGIGKPNMKLYEKHLSHPSPYNTYIRAGLPPGPICNPGAASIHAALYPKAVPYYFFVARGDGSHIFSITNREHNRARVLVKRQQR